jgi:hypothetical protein
MDSNRIKFVVGELIIKIGVGFRYLLHIARHSGKQCRIGFQPVSVIRAALVASVGLFFRVSIIRLAIFRRFVGEVRRGHVCLQGSRDIFSDSDKTHDAHGGNDP